MRARRGLAMATTVRLDPRLGAMAVPKSADPITPAEDSGLSSLPGPGRHEARHSGGRCALPPFAIPDIRLASPRGPA